MKTPNRFVFKTNVTDATKSDKSLLLILDYLNSESHVGLKLNALAFVSTLAKKVELDVVDIFALLKDLEKIFALNIDYIESIAEGIQGQSKKTKDYRTFFGTVDGVYTLDCNQNVVEVPSWWVWANYTNFTK